MSTNTSTIASIQVLRALAALMVLFFHATLLMQMIGYPYAYNLFAFGNAGVDVFFVLSGFIIYYTSIHKINQMTVKKFLLLRFIRIYPIYWVAFLWTLGIFLVGKYGLHVSSVNVQSFTSDPTVSSSSFLPLVKAFFLFPNHCPIVIVSWTLRFELLFYFLFGCLFFINPKWFIAALVLWVMGCYVNQYTLAWQNGILNPIVTDFLWGCCVAILISKRLVSLRLALLALISGLVIFILSAMQLNNYLSIHQDVSVLAFGLPAALMIYGVSYFDAVKLPRLFTFLGDASYSIYLFHFPLIAALLKLVLLLNLGDALLTFVPATLVFVLAIAICCLIYRFVEYPLMTYGKKTINSKLPSFPRKSVGPSFDSKAFNDWGSVRGR